VGFGEGLGVISDGVLESILDGSKVCSELGVMLGFFELGRFVGANAGFKEGVGVKNEGALESTLDGSKVCIKLGVVLGFLDLGRFEG